MSKKLITFTEGRPTSTGCPQVVVCRLTNDDSAMTAQNLEADLHSVWNRHDTLKKKAECYNDLLEALKGLANVISIDCDDYPDLGAYNQTLTKMANAKAVIKKAETI